MKRPTEDQLPDLVMPVMPDLKAFEYILEDLPGACEYWAVFDGWHKEDGEIVGVELAEIVEHPWPGQPAVYGEPVIVTVEKLVRAASMVAHPSSKVNRTIRQQCAGLLIDSGDVDWDYDTVDVLGQFAVVGELRYG